MLIMIQINLLKATTSDVMTNIAGGFLFNAYAYMRGEQSGNCSFSFVALLKKEGRFKGTEMLHCMVFREKPPKLKNAVPRPFWLCVPGIQGGRKWFDRLLSTFSGIQGQRKVKCVYRDFAAPGNSHDLRRATKAMLSLLTGVKLQRAVQVILMEVCDLSAGEAARFTVHSCRHCLPHCCAASHEPPEGSVECGRWATSTAQMHDLIPSELRQATEAKRAGNMPGSFIFSSYEGGTCWRNLSTSTP